MELELTENILFESVILQVTGAISGGYARF